MTIPNLINATVVAARNRLDEARSALAKAKQAEFRAKQAITETEKEYERACAFARSYYGPDFDPDSVW